MKRRIIPHNVLQGKRIFGLRVPNLIEGVVWALIAFILISQIPFVPKVRWITTICVSLFLIVFNGLGIKGQRFSVTVMNYIIYKCFMKNASYRRMNYDPEPDKLFEEANGKTRVITIHEKSAIGRFERIFKR